MDADWMDLLDEKNKEIERLRKALKKIANIKHEDIPSPITPNEANVWTILAMTVGLAEKALKEGE
jgi:hypothetical protein